MRFTSADDFRRSARIAVAGLAVTAGIPVAASLVVMAGLTVAPSEAHAQPAPTCNTVPMHFGQAHQGDVLLYPLTTLTANGESIVTTVIGAGSDPSLAGHSGLSTTAQTYGHEAIVWDSAASQLTDNNWSQTWLLTQAKQNAGLGNAACSLPIPTNEAGRTPNYLKYISPGIESGFSADGSNTAAGPYPLGPIQVLPHAACTTSGQSYCSPNGTFGNGTASCSGAGNSNGAPGGYKLDRFGFDDGTAAGQSADYMIYGCGVPWNHGASPCTAGQYLGCFADSATRDLPYAALTSSSMTPQLCEQTCASAGYQYAGVQDSTQCFCGSSYGSQGGSTGCNMACGGTSALNCGGSYANGVFTASNFCPTGPNGTALTTPVAVSIDETVNGTNLVNSVYWTVSNTISPSAGPCPSREETGDYGGMQILNEFFWGQGATDIHSWNPLDGVNRTTDYGPAGQPSGDDFIDFPDKGSNGCNGSNLCPNNVSTVWPGEVYPGPTPDRIMAAYMSQQGGTSGFSDYVEESSRTTCTCPSGYVYNTSTGTCQSAVQITNVVDSVTGATFTAHEGGYITITGTDFAGGGTDIVWLGTTYLGGGTANGGNGTIVLSTDTTTTIVAYVPTSEALGVQSLEVANPGVNEAFANVTVDAPPSPAVSYEYDSSIGENYTKYGDYFYVYGSNFSASANEAYLGGYYPEVVYNSTTEIEAYENYTFAAAGYQTLEVYNETTALWSNAISVYIEVPATAPSVSYEYDGSYGENYTKYGDYFYVYGSNFSASANEVYLGGYYPEVVYNSTTEIEVYENDSISAGYQTLEVYNETTALWSNAISVYIEAAVTTPSLSYEYDYTVGAENETKYSDYFYVFGSNFGSTNELYIDGYYLSAVYNSSTELEFYESYSLTGNVEIYVVNETSGVWSNGIAITLLSSGGGGTPSITGEEDDTYYHSGWIIPNAYFSVYGTNLQGTTEIYVGGYYPELTYASASQVNGYANTYPAVGTYNYLYLYSSTYGWTEDTSEVYIY